MIGSTVSHYRILDRLGQGGMGDVFLAEDLRLRRHVALKVLRQQTGCEDEERARLMREARAASALNHPHIAVIYDVEESDTPAGRVFLLSMEYVPGQTLAALAEGATLSLDDIIGLVAQAADALAEAHARGVVHRDVKPSNLMVAQGRLKVLDFGLARMLPAVTPDAPTWSREGIGAVQAGFEGTPHYMSPEQAMGKALDSRSDTFSLGVVFYELLAGRRPFEGANLVEVVDGILHRDPPPLPVRFADPRLPRVEQLVRRMLARDAAARPRSLREVAAELQRLRAPEGAAAGASDALTVAVAGFANITRQAEDEWLGTGLAEAVTAALQDMEGLVVWGRDRLRENLRRMGAEARELSPDDLVQLGRQSGARWVLAGGFQRLGEQVRVTARVVEVETGRVLRAVMRDGRLDRIFELQDQVVTDLSADLRRSVAAAHEGEETQIVAAYEALSKGLINMRSDSYESLERAILFFERALAHDPRYVRAQIELGAAMGQKADYFSAPELRERAAGILRRVIESNPRLARAWRELGMVLVSQGRVDEGIESMKRALTLSPEDPVVLAGMARAHWIGKADFAASAGYFERAVARNPQAGWYHMQLAHCYALTRDFARAEASARRAIELQEAFMSGQQGVHVVGAYMRLGHVLALRGEWRAACDAFAGELAFTERLDHALRGRIRVELHMRLGQALLELGEEERAAAAFATGLDAFTRRLALGADEPFTRYYAAAIHALRGEKDDALDQLEKAAAGAPAFTRARARIEPEWESLRNDLRFERLVAPDPGSGTARDTSTPR